MGLRASGVAFRLRPRPKTAKEASGPRPDALAPIEGPAWEAYAGPPPGPPKAKRGWTVAFTGARLEQVREVWIGARHLRGAGTVSASVTRRRRQARLHPGRGRAVLASYGAPSVGIELRDKERELRVLRPGHWFEGR